MNGVSHKTIGVGIALAVAYVGVSTGNASLCAAAVTAPLGAMLPDIDHDRSKLGQQRKQVTDTLGTIVKVGVGTTFLGTVLYSVYTTGALVAALLNSLIIWLPIFLCMLVATSDTLKRFFNFLTKHRGIMHTLWPVVGMLYGSYVLGNGFISSLVLGLSLGYLSHLLADMETVMGCPILWPLVRDNISLLKVRTGTVWETIVMLIDLAVIAIIAIMLSSR